MRRYPSFLLNATALLGAVLSVAQPAEAQGGHAALVELDAAIMPVTADFLARAIDKSADDGAEFLIIRLNTPGGLLDATRQIVNSIQTSRVPIVVYVAPTGAHAASAGTFLTAWAHVAAMAPVTNIGAASPVGAGGETLPETLQSKAQQDALALLDGIAETRGRDLDALRATVTDATAYSATAALELGIIDMIADDLDQLLVKLDGREICMRHDSSEAGASVCRETITLSTVGIEVRTLNRTVLEHFLGFLASPDVFFLLFIIGGILLLIEFVVPGLIVPGVAGAVLLALSFVAAGSLPVNIVGLALIVLAMVLFYVEIQVPGVSVAGAGGAICFVLGALLLFGGFTLPGLPEPRDLPSPDIRVNPWLIAGVAASAFGLLWFVVRDMALARKAGLATAAEPPTLVGREGVATTDLSPNGTVHVADELWSAVSHSGDTIPKDAEVTVVETEGLTVRVKHVRESGEYRSSRYDAEPQGSPE